MGKQKKSKQEKGWKISNYFLLVHDTSQKMGGGGEVVRGLWKAWVFLCSLSWPQNIDPFSYSTRTRKSEMQAAPPSSLSMHQLGDDFLLFPQCKILFHTWPIFIFWQISCRLLFLLSVIPCTYVPSPSNWLNHRSPTQLQQPDHRHRLALNLKKTYPHTQLRHEKSFFVLCFCSCSVGKEQWSDWNGNF